MSSLPRVSVLCALTVAIAGGAFAQPPGQLKKAPNQVVETGHDEKVNPQTGRAREATPEETAALETALQQFGKRAEGATFTLYDNGMVRAELDDSFMEAMTVTVMPDGSLKYGHTNVGTQTAVQGSLKKQAPAKATTKQKAKTHPPVFEEKE